jgi:hypothetical protein
VGDNRCRGGNTVNCDDNCQDVANADQADVDEDAVGDVCDNCIDVANTDQLLGSAGPAELECSLASS